MTLTQLEIFALVAHRKSFTAAATQLNISQSGVSHAIRSLEQELGVSLLHRHQGEIVLTDIGVRLLERAQTMLGVAETMRQEARDARGMKQGTLRIGSFGPTSSIRLLPDLLAAYRRLYPGIEVHVDEGPDKEVVQWLMSRRIGVGFVVLPADQFDTYPLIEDQMVVLLPTGHRLASQDAVALQALCDDPFVLTEAGSAEIVSGLFGAAKLQPMIRYRTTQLMSTLAIVARGDAMTIVAESSLPPIQNQDYVARPLHPPVKRRVGLAVRDERQSSPAEKAFIALAGKLYRQ
jgi:DNA-binding transcriptional LysR family regulator